MVRSAAYPRSRARVVDICERVDDPLAVRQQVLAEISQVVGFDAYVWLLTDPETSVGAAPLAEVPGALLPQLPRLIRLKYLTDINRWTTVDSSAVTLVGATGGDLSRSRLWREVLAEHGIVDVLSCVFRDRFGCWGLLDLWRAGPRTPFTGPEVDFLNSILATTTGALRRAQATTFTGGAPRGPDRPGPVVLLLSPDLEVLGQTPRTHEYLRMLVPPEGGRAPIPASAYNVGAQLLAVEAAVDDNPPAARVHLSGGLWVSLRAARLGSAESGGIPQNIAVTIEEASPAERVSLFGRAFGLSPRESELLTLLLTGIDTRELARKMNLSEYSVQDHLKPIFAKTGTRSRPSLVSRALGT